MFTGTQVVLYKDIRNTLQTGDLALFSGKGGTSTGIKWFTDCKWSHVGMLIRVPDWDTLLIWEATTLDNLKDVLTGAAHRGVQLVSFSDRLKSYDGEASIRKLDVQRTAQMQNSLIELRAELKDRPYEQDKVELLKAAYDGPLGDNTKDLSSLFCSELIAETYQRMGLLPTGPDALPSNEYLPKDFSEEGERLALQGNASLGPEISLSYTEQATIDA